MFCCWRTAAVLYGRHPQEDCLEIDGGSGCCRQPPPLSASYRFLASWWWYVVCRQSSISNGEAFVLVFLCGFCLCWSYRVWSTIEPFILYGGSKYLEHCWMNHPPTHPSTPSGLGGVMGGWATEKWERRRQVLVHFRPSCTDRSSIHSTDKSLATHSVCRCCFFLCVKVCFVVLSILYLFFVSSVFFTYLCIS